jgi:hypothetical protein
MRSFLLLTVVSYLFVLIPARPLRTAEKEPTFDSPEAVFSAFQQAWKDQDPAQMNRCLSSDYRQFMLAGLLFPVEPRRGQKSLADEFVDREALRKRLREVLPVRDAEALRVVKGLVKDPEAALIAGMKAQAALEKEREKERAARQTEESGVESNTSKRQATDKPPQLTKVKIDGDRAEAVLQILGEEVDEKDADHLPKKYFVKEEGQWRVDLDPETRKKLQGDEDDTKYGNWQELPPPRCKGPEEAFAYGERAEAERNPAGAWMITSPKARENVMKFFFWDFWERGGNGSLAAAIHVDLTALKDAQLHNSTGNLLECVRDEQAYFCSVVKWSWQAVEYENKGKRPKSKLLNVKIEGNRARGEVIQVSVTKAIRIDEGKNEEVYRDESEETKPRYFVLTGDGWLLDAPTKEESKRDFAEWEKAFNKREAERRAKEKRQE